MKGSNARDSYSMCKFETISSTVWKLNNYIRIHEHIKVNYVREIERLES